MERQLTYEYRNGIFFPKDVKSSPSAEQINQYMTQRAISTEVSIRLITSMDSDNNDFPSRVLKDQAHVNGISTQIVECIDNRMINKFLKLLGLVAVELKQTGKASVDLTDIALRAYSYCIENEHDKPLAMQDFAVALVRSLISLLESQCQLIAEASPLRIIMPKDLDGQSTMRFAFDVKLKKPEKSHSVN